MLDFFKYQDQIAILRTTTDGKLWRQFKVSVTDLPALFVIFSNGTNERLPTDRNTRYVIDTLAHKLKQLSFSKRSKK